MSVLQFHAAKNIEHHVTAKPTYHTRRTQYEIDRCDPQNRAIESGKIGFCALSKGHYPGTPMAKNILPGLNSIGFMDVSGAQDWGLDAHRNEGIEITFLETGRMVFSVERKRFDLRAGDFTVTRPWQLHKLGAPNIGPGRLHWLILDVGVRRPHQNWHWPAWMVLTPADLAELTHKLRHNESPVWSTTPAITHSFRELARTVGDWEKPHAVSRLATHLNQLFLGILEALSEQQTQEIPGLTSRQRTVELFLCELEKQPAINRKPWTIHALAEHCGMGVTAFAKYCRELVNASPMEYLSQCRLKAAARQLHAEPLVSITEIAHRHGFNTSQYFATCFLRQFGCTPREFRQGK